MISKLLQSRLAWAILSSGLRVGGYLLVLPIALRAIPEARMEIWWLFLAVQGLVVQADFGLGPSVSRGISYLLAGATSLKPGAAKAMTAADPDAVAGFIQSCHQVYRRVLAVALCLLVLASFFIVPRMGAGTFSGGDFHDSATFAARLREGDTPVAAWLGRQFPAGILGALWGDRKTNPDWDSASKDFVKALNELVSNGAVYDPERFGGVELRPDTRALLQSQDGGPTVVRANRLLLEDAFPDAISKDAAVLHGTLWLSMIASWAVFGFGVLLTLSTSRFINFLTGSDHVRLAQQIALAGMAVNLLLTAVGLLIGLGLAAMAIGSLGNGVVMFLMGRWGVRRHLRPYLHGGDMAEDGRVFRELWPAVWRAGMVSLGAYLIYNSNVFWAAANLGQPEASQYPFTLRLMQLLTTVCGLPIATQLPKLASWMAAGESRRAWSFFMRRHLLGLTGMVIGVIALWLFGDRLLRVYGSKSSLLPGTALLFMGLIYVLEFNHSLFATLVMTQNKVPFVWAATLSGVAICVGGGLFSPSYGLWGLLGTVFLVQASWNNWWVPWYAWRSVRSGETHG